MTMESPGVAPSWNNRSHFEDIAGESEAFPVFLGFSYP